MVLVFELKCMCLNARHMVNLCEFFDLSFFSVLFRVDYGFIHGLYVIYRLYKVRVIKNFDLSRETTRALWEAWIAKYSYCWTFAKNVARGYSAL